MRIQLPTDRLLRSLLSTLILIAALAAVLYFQGAGTPQADSQFQKNKVRPATAVESQRKTKPSYEEHQARIQMLYAEALIPEAEAAFHVGAAYIGVDKSTLLPHLRQHPNDIRCRLLLGLWSPDHGERLACVEALRKLDPENPGLALTLKAKALLDAGKTEGLRELIGEIAANPRANWHLDAFEIAGSASLRQMELTTPSDRLMHSGSYLLYDFYNAMAQPATAAWKEIPEHARVEQATDFLSIAARISADGKSDDSAQTIVRGGYEFSILSQLPAETEYGDSGQTVGQRIDAIVASNSEYCRLMEHLEANGAGLSEEQINGYIDRKVRQGQRDAMLWLRDEAMPK